MRFSLSLFLPASSAGARLRALGFPPLALRRPQWPWRYAQAPVLALLVTLALMAPSLAQDSNGQYAGGTSLRNVPTGHVPISNGTLVPSDSGISVSGPNVTLPAGGTLSVGGALSVTFATGNAASYFVSTNGSVAVSLNGAAGFAKQLGYYTGSLARWSTGASGIAESGSNAGSDYCWYRYGDSGSYLDNPFCFVRATGLGNFNDGLNSSGANAINTLSPTGSGQDLLNPAGGGLLDNFSIGSVVPGPAVVTNLTVGGAITIGPASGPAFASLVSATQRAIFSIGGTAGNYTEVQFYTGSTARWAMGKNADPETGSNAGANFALFRYTDTGVYVDFPVQILRSTGQMQVFDGLNSLGALIASGPNMNNVLSPTGTGTDVLNPAGGGSIDNLPIGNTTPAPGTFSTLVSNGGALLSGVNGVGTSTLTLNGTNASTGGSAIGMAVLDVFASSTAVNTQGISILPHLGASPNATNFKGAVANLTIDSTYTQQLGTLAFFEANTLTNNSGTQQPSTYGFLSDVHAPCAGLNSGSCIDVGFQATGDNGAAATGGSAVSIDFKALLGSVSSAFNATVGFQVAGNCPALSLYCWGFQELSNAPNLFNGQLQTPDVVLTGAAPAVSTNQVSFGGTVAAASNCGSLAGSAGCLVVNVAGTQHYVPYY